MCRVGPIFSWSVENVGIRSAKVIVILFYCFTVHLFNMLKSRIYCNVTGFRIPVLWSGSVTDNRNNSSEWYWDIKLAGHRKPALTWLYRSAQCINSILSNCLVKIMAVFTVFGQNIILIISIHWQEFTFWLNCNDSYGEISVRCLLMKTDRELWLKHGLKWKHTTEDLNTDTDMGDWNTT